MTKSFIPQGYKPTLSLYETQDAISFIKREFQDSLARALHLKRVSAPLFVQPETGLNDNLNGYERPVGFDIPYTGKDAQEHKCTWVSLYGLDQARKDAKTYTERAADSIKNDENAAIFLKTLAQRALVRVQ